MSYDGPVNELQYSPSEVDDVQLISIHQLQDIYESKVRLSCVSILSIFSPSHIQ